ncbi:VOC family protein [Williamsia sp.]|uniref:VOC family protein n=1 Tax=Williamsia sp. TaxID=1872085 RepID=UPI002F93DA6D
MSADDALVDFYVTVFQMERLEVTASGSGTVHRLRGGGTTLKLMVPKQKPSDAESTGSFLATTGLRYLTFYVADGLETLIERGAGAGGRVQMGPMDIGPGKRLAIITDPDGNTLELVEETAA